MLRTTTIGPEIGDGVQSEFAPNNAATRHSSPSEDAGKPFLYIDLTSKPFRERFHPAHVDLDVAFGQSAEAR